MGAPSDIERLIELGLNRYGAGDLEGALLMWEEALAIDPDNAQATSYLDYVRHHYDLLSAGTPGVTRGDDEPFAIEEVPEYQIELAPGELVARDSQPIVRKDEVDAGWFDEEATHDAGARLRTESQPSLELEAEEPPPPPEVNFEDATREYHGASTKPSQSDYVDSGASEFQQDEFTGGFSSEGTPVGFRAQDQQATEIRKRDLGFVQPARGSDIGLEKTLERGPFASQPSEEDLVSGLPTPLPRDVPTRDLAIPKPQTTRDLPEPRPPARRESAELSQAEVMLPHAPTQDFDPAKIDIGAPTRELGLRPKPTPAPLASPDDDEVPTKQSDVRAIRAAAARDDGRASRPGTETRSDIVLPFDPIDARSAQILDEVDENAPAHEERDEQTRRRIGALLAKAVAYNDAGDTDRAVTAVDLALSEDPNSALGQKLITRNRDTIMAIFQSFIGDLERQPQLARPLHELQNAPISPRAAFLLSRIDGTLTIDELLDVSGMPRMEAFRHICQLLLRGILR